MGPNEAQGAPEIEYIWHQQQILNLYEYLWIYAFSIDFHFSKFIGPCVIQFPDWFRTGYGLPDWSNYARSDQKYIFRNYVFSGLVPD